MLTMLLIYCCVGAVVGILAGLLGVGGGGVIVPILVFLLPLQGVSHDIIMHLAIGTSLASIVFTSISSLRAHHRRGAVDWQIVRQIVVGILLGTFLGSCFAAALTTTFLIVFFALFLLFVAAQILLNQKPKPTRSLPGAVGMSGVGGAIGFLASLTGIGGGALSVPFMVWCNVRIHRAIGTSAAIGLPIAVAGTVGYVFNGWGVADLPSYSVGFVYLPALVGIAAISILTAPLGARLAHSLPVGRLKKIFALLLLAVGIKMLFSVW